MWNRDGNLGTKVWHGDNPPAGALITFYLKTQPPGPVNVTITDKDGKTVRRMNRVVDEPGVNRVAWDLQFDAIPGGGGGRGGGGGGRGGAAPGGAAAGAAADTSLAALRARRRAATEDESQAPQFDGFGGGAALSVLPGAYTVTLTVEGKRYTKNVEVSLDPRSDMTPAQLTAQYTAARAMEDLAVRVNRIIASVDDLSRQMTSLQDQLRRAPANAADSAAAPPRQVLAELDVTLRELKQFKDSVLARPLPGLGYRQYPRLSEEVQTVSGMISRPMMQPTAGEMLRSMELGSETNQAQGRLDAIIQTHVVKINDLLKGTPHVLIQAPARTFVP
jgi:hypothetical protein